MRHIALIAPMLSGKSTAAEHLVAAHGYRRMALAEPLKEDGLDLLNEWLFDRGYPTMSEAEAEREKARLRPFWQWFGTDFVRWRAGADYWANLLLDRAAESPRPVVCDDCRFPNEAKLLAEGGFALVRIERPLIDRRIAVRVRLMHQGIGVDDPTEADAEIDRIMAHASETSHAAINADVTIDNDAGLGKLRASLDAVVRWGDVPTNDA